MIRTSFSAVASPKSLSECSFDSLWRPDAQQFPSYREAVAESTQRFFSPVRYEPGYAYPLLIWLHSDESSEHELDYVMPALSMQNYVAVAPRGTVKAPGERNRFRWRQCERQIEAAQLAVERAAARAQQRFHVNPRHLFLAGYGAGGEMALRLALGEPQSYAGAISINGRFPTGRSPLGRIHEARKLPVLLIAGLESRAYPDAQVDRDLRLLHSAGIGVQVLKGRECGDELTTDMLQFMNQWIMDRVCPPVAVGA